MKIAPSKNKFRNIDAHLNCSLKKHTSKLLSLNFFNNYGIHALITYFDLCKTCLT